MPIFLHDHKEFPTLLRIIEEETGVLAAMGNLSLEKIYQTLENRIFRKLKARTRILN